MSNDFTPDADDQMPEKKTSQQLLILLLLLLVGLFAYLYFFTGLIKPRQEQPQPQPVAEAPVKTPLPPRAGQPGAQPATPGTQVAVKAGEPQPAAPLVPQAQPVKPATPAKEAPAAKPATAAKAPAATKAATAPTAKPAAPAAQAKAAKPAAPSAQAKGKQPAAATAKEAKPATVAGKAPAAKASAEAKTAAKMASGAKTAAAKAPGKGAYTLEITGDLLESEMGSVMAKLKQAGISHLVKTKSSKGEPMHRLFLADFADRNEAVEELERLKLAAPDSFMLKENSRYAVYAGSFLREGKAAVAQDRLYEKGVKLLLKSATVPVAVVKVRAGSFADQAGAAKAAKTLKKAGLPAKVVRVAGAEK